MSGKKWIGEFLRFGVVGVAATLLQWGIYALMANALGIYYLLSSIVGFLISTVVNYLLSKIWVFQVKQKSTAAREFMLFLLTSLIALAINTAVLWLCVDVLFQANPFAGFSDQLLNMAGQVAATAVVLVWNYLIRKFWVFRQKDALK